jgi:hypothetical protein
MGAQAGQASAPMSRAKQAHLFMGGRGSDRARHKQRLIALPARTAELHVSKG